MKEDDSLYNVMIWTLVIGIIVVILTLFLTRPAPENFTELYFNNHTSLMEYASLNDTAEFGFAIHNLENKKISYNYSISAELYTLDYSCTKPEIYLEEKNTTYSDYLAYSEDIMTRATQTEDPELIIKSENYTVSFNYRIYSGQQIVYGLTDIHNNPKYAIIINHASNILYFVSPDITTQFPIKESQGGHYFSIDMRENLTTLTLDKQNFTLKTPEDYSRGFPYLETTNTYAEITNMIITRGDNKQNIILRLADSRTETITLEKQSTSNTMIVYSKFLATNLLYDKLLNMPSIETRKVANVTTQYYSNDTLNLSNDNIKINYRASKILIGLNDLKINYDIAQSFVNITYAGEEHDVEYKTKSRFNQFNIEIQEDRASIFLNNKNLINITGFNNTHLRPYIETYESIAIIREFSIKSYAYPKTYSLKAVDLTPKQSYAGLYSAQTFEYISNPQISFTAENETISSDITEEQQQRFKEFVEQQKLTWTDYSISVIYLDQTLNNTFTLSLKDFNQTIYGLTIDSTTGNYEITYWKDNTLRTYKNKTNIVALTRLSISAYQDTLSISINDKEVFDTQVDKTTNGMLLMDYPNMNLLSAQADNKETGETKLYKRQTYEECSPKILNIVQYSGTESIWDGESKIFNSFVKFQEPFDLAKVKVSISYYQDQAQDSTIIDKILGKNKNTEVLNDQQEIHFYVKNI